MARWLKIVVKGDERILRGFLVGFGAAAGRRHQGAVLGSDVPVAPESLTERVQQLLAAGSHHVVLTPEGYGERLMAAIGKHGGNAGLVVESSVEVAGGSFEFRAETFSREGGGLIRRAFLDAVPEGIEIRDLRTDEEVDPSGAGQELYSPVHHYSLLMRGQIIGPLPGVLEMHRRARSLEEATAESVHIFTA
jgi:hypothetical protein